MARQLAAAVAIGLAVVLAACRGGGQAPEAPVQAGEAFLASAGELLGLKWGDVDIEGGALRVQRSLSVVRRQMYDRQAKARSAQAVPLWQVAVAALQKQRERWRERCGTEPSVDDYVFVREGREPGSPSWVRRHFARLAASVGLTGLRLHDLRHMVASLLLARGASVRAVAEVLGHRVPSTTLNAYSHVLMGGTREVVALLDDLLLGGERQEQGGASPRWWPGGLWGERR